MPLRPVRRASVCSLPMASTSRRRLDAFLRTAVAPMLRDEGFTQSGHSWRRRMDDAIAVLAIHGNP